MVLISLVSAGNIYVDLIRKSLGVEFMIRVGIVGYGTIGKRVADAVSLQDDMRVMGVVVRRYDWRTKMAIKRGYNIYVSEDADMRSFKEGNFEPSGGFEDLIRRVDVVVDATPKGVGSKNKGVYDKYGVKMVFEGGEKHDLTGVSFVATRNYLESLGKEATRVVSCNTTAICRVIGALHERIGVKKARVAIFRRAADPWESHIRGIINTAIPTLKVPSHHGPDVRTVIPDLNIVTMAVVGSHNLYHIHVGFLELREEVSRSKVLDILIEEPRVVLVKGRDGIVALNSIFELGRDLNRSRGDIYEIPVWEDGVKVNGKEVYMFWATPNESNVVPDNVDAIRALTGVETDPFKSISKTDKALGVLDELY